MTVAANSTHLLEIDLYDLPLLESASVTALMTSCPNLRELRLARCPRIGDPAFHAIPSKPPQFDALRILDLTDCFELGDKAVEKIISSCPRLRNLILAKCRQLTDRAVWAITKLGKNLHYIHLGHCARITDSSIVALAKACNRIRYIDLACCSNLSDTSITQLANLPKLKRVGLVKCAGITDRSIRALATYGGRIGLARPKERSHNASVLERVHLSYCTQLTLDGIHTLLNHCPRLTHLSLTGVQAFLRDDLTVFCREAPSEFNDHQREVFCVFSGTGVARLRDYLNRGGTNVAVETGIVDSEEEDGEAPAPPAHGQGGNQDHAVWAHGDQDGVEDEDMDDDETPVESQEIHATGQGLPGSYVDVQVHSTPSNDNARMMSTPQGIGFAHPEFLQQQAHTRTQSWDGVGGAMWAHGPSWATAGLTNNPQSASNQGPSSSSLASVLEGVSNVDSVMANGESTQAQHVTGMMGAVNMGDRDDGV
jgi:F-box and leucine-rich repeat protein GRR1